MSIAPRRHSDISCQLPNFYNTPQMVAHYNFKTRVGAAIDRFDLSIYKALVGDVTYCSGFCNLYGTPVGAPES